jgi:hypothetical protein
VLIITGFNVAIIIILLKITIMKQCVQWCLVMTIFINLATAQINPEKNYRNFPVVLSVQFHSLAFPLKDVKTNFKNLGLGIGTEIALGNSHNWAQQFQILWYKNKQAGNGILIYTQSSWRPTFISYTYTELKVGLGLTYNFRPVESFQQNNGEWHSAGQKGKWLFTVPVGVSLGYNKYAQKTYVAPFASYQILFNANYAKGVPVITNSLVQIGTRIHLSNKN